MDKITGKTKHGELSIDEIASLMPGMSEMMVALGQRYHVMFHACKAGNWALGAYQLRAIRKLFTTAKLTRPKYREALDAFAAEHLDAMDAAIRDRDWPRFAAAAERSIVDSDRVHAEWGYAYIRYRMPETAPPGVLLEPPKAEGGPA
jgi:hypothetical protein